MYLCVYTIIVCTCIVVLFSILASLLICYLFTDISIVSFYTIRLHICASSDCASGIHPEFECVGDLSYMISNVFDWDHKNVIEIIAKITFPPPVPSYP